MRGRLLVIVLLAGAFLALLASATIAAADPSDIGNPPTEDWIFDQGRTVTISGMQWTVGYNITVTGGSDLTLDSCDWSMEPAAGSAPVWIFVDDGASLTIDSSNLISADGAPGFYLESEGNLSLLTCTLKGLVTNPAKHGGISLYYSTATLHTATIVDSSGANAIYALNSDISIWWSLFNGIEGNAIRLLLYGSGSGESHVTALFNTMISNVGGNGIYMSARNLDGTASLDVSDLRMDNISLSGIFVEQGDGTSGDGGTGAVLVNLDSLLLLDVGENGIFATSMYQVQSSSGLAVFNLSLSNSQLARTTGAGVYAQITDSDVRFEMVIDSTVIEEIAADAEEAGLQGIVIEHTISSRSGSVNTTITDSVIRKAAWGGILDKGNNDLLLCVNTSISNNTGYGIYNNIPKLGAPTPVVLDGCTFIGNDGYGLYMTNEAQARGGSLIEVSDCTFLRNKGPALVISIQLAVQAANPINVGLNITGCVFADSPDQLAVLADSYRLVGSLTLNLVDTRINNTAGVLVAPCILASCDYVVHVRDSSITNTTQCSLDVTAKANTQTTLNVTIEGLYAHSLVGDAVSLVNNLGKETTSKLVSKVTIRDSTIFSAKDRGLTVATNGKHVAGENTVYIGDSTIMGYVRAVVISGHDGSIEWCTLWGRMSEDLLAIDSEIDLWHISLSGSFEDKVNVLTRGEVRLFCTLDVKVVWSTGSPAIGATVWVRDNSLATLTIQSARAPEGTIPQLMINTYILQASGGVSRNPYTINASFSGVSNLMGMILEKDTEVTIVLHDNIVPDVHILSPEDGTVQQSRVLRVVGTAWDDQSDLASLRLSIDGENWTEVGGSTSWNLRFDVDNETIDRFDGQLLVQAVAVDNAGNEASDMIAVKIVTRPPGVTLHFPPDGYITNMGSLTVLGLTDRGASVMVNGETVVVTDTLFSHTVRLVEGVNTISVMSIDVLGNTNTVRVHVVLDTQEPFFVIESPRENTITNSATINLVALLENDLVLTVNGDTVPYGSASYPIGDGRLEHLIYLAQGENEIFVEAFDRAGNAFRATRLVVFDDTPPTIVVTQPASGSHLSSHFVQVAGVVESTATLRLNGEEVTTSSGTFSVSILATEGPNTITLWAVDRAGNERSLTLDFIVDTLAPALSMTAPTKSPQMVMTNRFEITGSVWMDDAPTAVTLLLDGMSYVLVDDGEGGVMQVDLSISQADGTFRIPVDLREGLNEFIVTVVDVAGNTATSRCRIVLDTIAPVLTVSVDPSRETDAGFFTWGPNIHITGFTEAGAALTFNGVTVPVGEDGSFEVFHTLGSEGFASFTLTSTDTAGNVRVVETSVEYSSSEEDEGGGASVWLLAASLVVFLAFLAVAYVFVRSRSIEIMMEQEEGEGMDETDDDTEDLPNGPGEADAGFPARKGGGR